jgi:hypothetical protein
MMAAWSWSSTPTVFAIDLRTSDEVEFEPLHTGSREWDDAIERLQALAA